MPIDWDAITKDMPEPTWKTPADLSRMSIEAHIREHGGDPSAWADPLDTIDSLLDRVHPEAVLVWMCRKNTDQWLVEIRYPYTEDLPYDCQTYSNAVGIGPTRMEALRDAIQIVKERGADHDRP